jgi:hypothetical protein
MIIICHPEFISESRPLLPTNTLPRGAKNLI